MLRKIEELIKNGWIINFCPDYDKYIEVAAAHNTFGNVIVTEEDIRIALDKVYNQAMAIRKGK